MVSALVCIAHGGYTRSHCVSGGLGRMTEESIVGSPVSGGVFLDMLLSCFRTLIPGGAEEETKKGRERFPGSLLGVERVSSVLYYYYHCCCCSTA